MPLTDDAGRFKSLRRVFIESAGQFEIETARFHKSKLLLKFKGFNNINEVIGLKGLYITIDESDRVKLPEDSYFVFDLIGCEVVNLEGESLGAVTDVLTTGGVDVYVIKRASGYENGDDARSSTGKSGEGSEELMLPAVKSVIKKVFIKEKRIIVDFAL